MHWGSIDPALLVVNLVVLLLSLSIHEAAHAWTANRFGDPTGRSLGRVTLNPIPHIDLFGTIVFPLLCLLGGFGVVFGWAKPVPVNTSNLKRPKTDHALVAFAGPASNLLAAACFLGGLRLFSALNSTFVSSPSAWTEAFWALLQTGLFLNVILAVFNLIPIPPLDGSWILAGILPDPWSGLIDSIRPYGFLLLVLLLWSGLFGSILLPVLAFVRRLAL